MASFGVILRSGRPYTLTTAPGAAGRLHLTQVSLDDGPGENTVTVCCTVGNKIPIIIARLLPLRAESLQLDLRYNLSEEAIFSVLGHRKVHLAGYFDGLDVSANSESFGEDIAHDESEKSIDDDAYDGSFINDSDPGYSSSSANSSFEAKERPADVDDGNKKKLNGKKHSRQRPRKVVQIVSSADSSGQSGGNGTKIKAVVSDSDDDIEFYENSLLKRKLPVNGSVEGAHQKSMSTVQDLTRNSEQVNDSAEKLVPDTDGLLVSTLNKQSAKRKDSKDGSKDADPGSLRANGTMERELRQNIIENTHEAGKPAPSQQMTVEAATESKARKKKNVKGDPSQNVNDNFHEADKPETAIPHSPQTAKETGLELKAKKKKKKVKGELGGTDELTKEQVSGIPIAMDEEKQLVSVKCVEACEANCSSLQPNELVKDDSVRSKKRKKHDVKGQNSAVVDHETETTGVVPATAVASLEKVEDESKKEKSEKCKKKRKRSESSNTDAEVVDTEPKVWTSANGVVVEELVQGNPDGKIALPGKKISVKYVGKLEGSNDCTTSSNSPLKFRLGAHDAIVGWNEGLEGVRTGGKRRLTVPTSESPKNDCAGSRMIYEIEVLRVC